MVILGRSRRLFWRRKGKREKKRTKKEKEKIRLPGLQEWRRGLLRRLLLMRQLLRRF